MSEGEFKLLLKAIGCFMQDDPEKHVSTEKELKEYRGWEGGMDILQKLRINHIKRIKGRSD